MKFKDINFSQRHGSKNTALGVCLPGGSWVNKSLFEEAWTRVCEGLPSPDSKELHTAKSMYGSEDWDRLNFGVRNALGRCVKYFVVQGMLHLKIANPTKKGTRKYIGILAG